MKTLFQVRVKIKGSDQECAMRLLTDLTKADLPYIVIDVLNRMFGTSCKIEDLESIIVDEEREVKFNFGHTNQITPQNVHLWN